MKKKMKTTGIILLILAVILFALAMYARSMFYGIMDAPYSVYGKYQTYMKWFLIAAVITAVGGIFCLIYKK